MGYPTNLTDAQWVLIEPLLSVRIGVQYHPVVVSDSGQAAIELPTYD
jgi:hypothetical protein